MSASSVLLVAASIVATDGSMATIDAGKAQLLQPGDPGQAYYELVVNGDPQRIDIGPVVVAQVSDAGATVTTEPGIALRLGHRVELRLPPERLNRPTPTPAAPVSAQPPKRPAPVPAVGLEPEPEPDPEPDPDPPPVPRNALTIPTGQYAIGLEPRQARFHNQTPRHEVLLQAFAIDRFLVGKDRSLVKGGTPATSLNFFNAQERCHHLGLRLPTEQEWEIAAQTPGFHLQPGFHEWTDSWYQGYPGNDRSEEGYGEIHKVLRGSQDGSTEALFARNFMNPNQHNIQVGFRCVNDLP